MSPAGGRPSPSATARDHHAGTGPTRPMVRQGAIAEGVVRVVSAVALAYALYYIVWRWTATLNVDALWLSLPLVIAETWGVLAFAGMTFTTWRLKRRRSEPAPENLRVAVFITTYDEPLSVVRKTAAAAREIRYPHQTYILDDGRRDEVRALAGELGVRYIRREDNEHAKAGNLNHALSVTDEEFILQLDADHVPLPQILDRTLGYFRDERVAFIQTPQDFYNSDSFTHVVDEEARRIWEEQRLFFYVIQPGKDRWNASFFCGSCGVMRRSALAEVGGFSTETITEDAETALLLHARGWKSVYVDEPLAYGLSPGGLAPYLIQRLRWGQGSMQILRRFNPLTLEGLTLAQRISYFLSFAHYFDGLQRMVFIATPLLFFATGALPVMAVDREFLARLVPFLCLMVVSFELQSRGHGHLWLAERFTMARWPAYVRAMGGLFTRRRLNFAVTPKGNGDPTPLRMYLPQLVILALSPVVILWATFAARAGWVDYGGVYWGSAAFLVGAWWVLWNAYFAWVVVRMARTKVQEEEYRFPDTVPIRFHVSGRVGVEAKPGLGMTHQLGSSGLRFLSTTSIEPMERLRIHLSLSTGPWNVECRVTGREQRRRGGIEMFDYHVAFEGLSLETQVAMELHCVHHSVPARAQHLSPRPDLFEDLRLWFRERRKEARIRVHLPAQIGVLVDGSRRLRWFPAVLEDWSPGGLLLFSDRQISEEVWLRCQIPGMTQTTEGIVRHARAVVTPRGCRWALGVECRPALEGALRRRRGVLGTPWKPQERDKARPPAR